MNHFPRDLLCKPREPWKAGMFFSCLLMGIVQGDKCRQRPEFKSVVNDPTSFLKMICDDNTTETLTTYIQRNVPYEVKIAQAINVMVNAITKSKYGILRQHSMQQIGVGLVVTIRKWASAFVTAITTCSKDDMSDDECIGDFFI